MKNKYCSNCLRTRRFVDLGGYMVCERCSKRLERVRPRTHRPTVRQVPWVERPAERPKYRRDAM